MPDNATPPVQCPLTPKDIRAALDALAEENYRKFSARLLPPGEHVLGVRLPALRRLAKRIAAGPHPERLLEQETTGTFEEDMLKGMVIGYAPCSLEERLRRIRAFVPSIRNWSVCDSFCAGLKFTEENKQRVWEFLQPYFSSEQEYAIRFACVMMLDYYNDEEHLAQNLRILDRLGNKPQYALMAVAWALSMLYVRFPGQVEPYFANSALDKKTFNAALQKIVESRKTDAVQRKRIRRLKRP